MSTKPPPRGRLSRPARIADLEAATKELAVEYQEWLDAIPANLAEGDTGDQLSAAIEQLEEIADALAAIDPPVVGVARSRPPEVTP